jgi:type IV pilus assembly protein PilC
MRDQSSSKSRKDLFEKIMKHIEEGNSLATSLMPHKKLFGSFAIHIIRVGEQTGSLSENLVYLSEELSKQHALRRKVQGALIYPLCITVATIGVTSLLVMFIFPKIIPIFTSLNIKLPLLTMILLSVSNFLREYGLLVIVCAVLFVILFFVFRSWWKPIRRGTDWLLLNIPIVGTMAKMYNATNFCRTLTLTLKAGMPINEGIAVTKSVTENTLYKDAYSDIEMCVVRGEMVSHAMKKYQKIFPDMLPHMIQVGETSGSLPQALTYLSTYYEAEIDDRTKNLSHTIEPVLLITMGALVGLIAISVITPIYEITRHMQSAR